MIKEALLKPSDDEWQPPAKVQVDPFESQRKELVSLFSRSIFELGKEETSWLVQNKDWKSLYQSILEISDALYRSKEAYINAVRNRQFDLVCSSLSTAIKNQLGVDISCNVKLIEYFFQNKY